jgi:hypothetical protein
MTMSDQAKALMMGRRGALFFFLIFGVVLGMLWVTWIGAPDLLRDDGKRILSRAHGHSQDAGPLLWYSSVVVSILTILLICVFLAATVWFRCTMHEPATGRNYSPLVGVVVLLGAIGCLLGTLFSTMAN